MRTRLLSIAALAVAVALAAGCGGGKSSKTSSASDWASGYCSAAQTWVSMLNQARASVKAGQSTASDAAQTVSGQTNTFVKAMSGLGTPDTPDGSAAADAANGLAQLLQGRVGRISAAINTNNPSITPGAQKAVVQEQIHEAIADMKSTTASLEQIDAELGAAMKASPDCAKLDASLAAAG